MNPERAILVVDDEPDMCWALQHVLQKAGYRAVTVRSGAEALALLERNAFAMILLDAKLTDMDGLEVARRAHQRHPEGDIILVSGYFYSDDPAIRQALAAGVIRSFIAKPFSHKDILRAVTRR